MGRKTRVTETEGTLSLINMDKQSGNGISAQPFETANSENQLHKWQCQVVQRTKGSEKYLSLADFQYAFIFKNVVRELIRRFWARRRRQKTTTENAIPDHLAAMATVRDQVSDMLSEIRNILKTNKQRKDRDRHQLSDEGHLQVNNNELSEVTQCNVCT